MVDIANLIQALAGGNQGFQQGREMQEKRQARELFGNSLASLYGGGPQGSPQPNAPAIQPTGSPSLPPGMPGQPPMQGSTPPGGQSPMQSGGMMPQQQGLTWQKIIQAAKQQNPSLSGTVLADLVDQYTPMMAAQSKAEWNELRSYLKGAALNIAQKREGTAEMNAGTNKDKAVDSAIVQIMKANGGKLPKPGTPEGQMVDRLLKQRAAGGGSADAGGGAVTINSDEEYEKLPSGTPFIGPDGQQRVKP